MCSEFKIEITLQHIRKSNASGGTAVGTVTRLQDTSVGTVANLQDTAVGTVTRLQATAVGTVTSLQDTEVGTVIRLQDTAVGIGQSSWYRLGYRTDDRRLVAPLSGGATRFSHVHRLQTSF